MYDLVADGYVREEFCHGVAKFLEFITDNAFDILLEKIKKILPEDNELPKNYYETKKNDEKIGNVRGEV